MVRSLHVGAVWAVVLVLVLDAGIAGAAVAAVIAEATGLLLGILIARRVSDGRLGVPRAVVDTSRPPLTRCFFPMIDLRNYSPGRDLLNDRIILIIGASDGISGVPRRISAPSTT